MNILWYGSPELKERIAPKAHLASEALSGELNLQDLIVIEADYGEGIRTTYPGICWLQRLRHQARLVVPSLVYSFEERNNLAKRYSILGPYIPGLFFLRLPFTSADFEELTRTAEVQTPLTQEQLNSVVRWHCGLDESWHRWSHELGKALSDWPVSRDHALDVLTEWSASIRADAPDQLDLLEDLLNALDESLEKVRFLQQQLEDGLCGTASHSDDLPPAPYPRPPQGFEAIAIGDDQGYERTAIRALEELGYTVVPPARTLAEAGTLFAQFCPQVILADLNFPSPTQGERLIQLARETSSVRLVIAISRARPEDRPLPEDVDDCCGSFDFIDVDRIHRLIWRRASANGVTDHV